MTRPGVRRPPTGTSAVMPGVRRRGEGLVAVDGADLEGLRGRFAETAAEGDAGARDVRDGLRWLAAERRLCPSGSRPGRVVEAGRVVWGVAGGGVGGAVAGWGPKMGGGE